MPKQTAIKRTNEERLSLLLLSSPSYLTSYITKKRETTSLSTLYHHALELTSFLKYLSPDDKPVDYSMLEAVTKEDISSYISKRETKTFTSRTKKTKLSVIRSFYSYLNETGKVKSNPAALIKSPSVHPKKNRQTLSSEDIRLTLYRYAKGGSFSARELSFWEKNRYRNLAILILFLNTGLSLTELTSLNMGDLLFDGGVSLTDTTLLLQNKDPEYGLRYIERYMASESGERTKETIMFPDCAIFLGTAGNYRTVHVNEITSAALFFYFAYERMEKPIDALFLSGRNRRISDRAVQKLTETIFSRYCSLEISPEDLRLYHAKTYFRTTKNLAACAKRLGYTDTSYLFEILVKADMDSPYQQREAGRLDFF